MNERLTWMLPSVSVGRLFSTDVRVSAWFAIIPLVVCPKYGMTLGLTFTLLLAVSVRAATFSWTNSAGGSWHVAANWLPNTVPSAGDTALVTNIGTYSVVITNSVSPAVLRIGSPGSPTVVVDNFATLSCANCVITNGGTNIVSGGTLSARGRAAPGGAVEAEINGAAIALAPLQTFVARQANVVLASGEMAFAGRLKTSGAKAALSYQGSAGINNLKINDPAGVLLAGWKSLATTTLRVQTAPTQIEIDTLHWQTPAGKFAIAADRTTNFRRALKTNGEKTAATPAPTTAAAAATPPATSEPAGKDAFALQIRRVEIKDGALDFSDETIGGGFATGIQEFNHRPQHAQPTRHRRTR